MTSRETALRLAVATVQGTQLVKEAAFILARAEEFRVYLERDQSGSGQPSDVAPGRMPARRRNRQDAGPADRTAEEAEIAG